MRLYEYAKKIGVQSKDVLDLLRTAGHDMKSHFVEATPDMIMLINKEFGSRTADKVELSPADSARRDKKKKPEPVVVAPVVVAEEPKKKQPIHNAMKPKKIQVPIPTTGFFKKPQPAEQPASGEPGSGDGQGGEGGENQPYQPLSQHQAHRHKRADFKRHQTITAAPDEEEVAASSTLLSSVLGMDRSRRARRSKRRKPTNTQIAERAVRSAPPALMPGSGAAPRKKLEATPEGVVEITPPITLRDLAGALGVKLDRIMRFLMTQGTMARLNDVLPNETLELIGTEFEKEIRFVHEKDLEDELHEEIAVIDAEAEENRSHRPPVVAFLGHVDHGKTSLLDCIRKTRVVDTESGGITQHIGAYQVALDRGRITFIDTPGHEAFSTMRARGANLTDIVVLVVAADDGPMPQTKEAFSHAKAAGVPVIVALNKCDLPTANPDRAMQALSAMDEILLPEEWGGRCGMIRVSAQTGMGVEQLLERILLEAEMLELGANPDIPAQGNVLEAMVSEGRGVVANALVTNGTLKRGDVVLCSSAFGKVKLMFDGSGHTLQEAGPSTPIQFTGLDQVPAPGDRFYVLDDISKAREIAEKRGAETRHQRLQVRAHVDLENLQEYLANAAVKELRVVLKADMTGTLEVLRKTLTDLSTSEVKITIIHEGVGGINRADVILANASDAIVIGFHVGIDSMAKLQADAEGVNYKVYHIIYRMVEDMKAALSGLLPPEEREVVTGHIQIRQIFKISRVGTIAGAYVTDGKVARSNRVRLFRDNVMIYEGRIGNLQRFKDQVREVSESYECGVQIENYNDIREGDVIEAFTIEEIARTLA